MEIVAFCQSLTVRIHQQLARNVPSTARLLCSSSSSPSSKRGAWDLDHSMDIERQPNPGRSYANRRSQSRSRHAGESHRPSSKEINYRRRSDRDDAKSEFKTRFQTRQRQTGQSWDEHGEDGDFDRNRITGTSSLQQKRVSGNRYGQNSDQIRKPSPERSLIREALDSEYDDLIYGISPVLLALRSNLREKYTRLFLQKRGVDSSDASGPSRKPANAEAIETILSLATHHAVPVVSLSKGDLNLLSENRPHQGIILQAAKRDFEHLKALPTVDKNFTNKQGRSPCYLVLDEVTDPQNAGALLRSAYFLGADGVVFCKRNSCSLSAVVSKASAGALEVMPVFGVTSMPRFLRASHDSGWRILGMSCSTGSVPAKQLNLDCPTLIVLGSEGRGLRILVQQACDVLVKIEGWGPTDEVDSLNVSVAGAVALYQLLGK